MKNYKELTTALSVAEIPLPKKLHLSLSQHAGTPAISIVKKGDLVNEGDLIAKAASFISAPIHAPVSGRVHQITKASHVAGIPLNAIIIERDESLPPRVWPRNALKLNDLTIEKFIEILKEKGIVGLGGAVFPTYAKFIIKENQKIAKILINACECEPYINVDNRAILDETEAFFEGLKILQQATKVPEIIIGIEDNKSEAIALLKKEIPKFQGLSFKILKTKYPQGAEKILIKSLLKKEVPINKLPLDLGVIVLNVNTVIAIRNAVFFDKPLIDRLITVSGLGINAAKNLRVKIGTIFADILNFCGGLKDTTQKLIIGGPMMGFAQADDQASVLKSTTSLLALTKKEIGSQKIEPCLKCGACVRNCPMHLVPTEIAKYVEFNRLDLAKKANITSCIECGCCVYSCPASARPLVQLIRLGKKQLLS